MKFDPGFQIFPRFNPMGFFYGPDCFGPPVENRSLDSIRMSLLDPDCIGPDPVYSIAMDVGKLEHRSLLKEMNLLFGAVIYATGRLGKEPVRSQGHVHKQARENRLPPPEVYEIWNGKAIVYMQERASDDPGRCFAIEADAGKIVVVPPGWAHATISADPEEPLVFGAWCDRSYGFEYGEVRARRGLAWFPVIDEDKISWLPNEKYHPGKLITKKPELYHNLGLDKGLPIYSVFEQTPSLFKFVAAPELESGVWENFIP